MQISCKYLLKEISHIISVRYDWSSRFSSLSLYVFFNSANSMTLLHSVTYKAGALLRLQ